MDKAFYRNPFLSQFNGISSVAPPNASAITTPFDDRLIHQIPLRYTAWPVCPHQSLPAPTRFRPALSRAIDRPAHSRSRHTGSQAIEWQDASVGRKNIQFGRKLRNDFPVTNSKAEKKLR